MTNAEYQRRMRTLTQREVARRAGCSHVYVGLVERGHRQPSEKLGRKLARALGMKPDDWRSLAKIRPHVVGFEPKRDNS